MINKILKICIWILLFGCLQAYGQHSFHFSQYVINPYLFNPAAGGTSSDLDVKVGYRKQWVNFPGAPMSYYASFHTPIFNRRKPGRNNGLQPFHSIGGIVYQDEAGPVKRTSATASYAYSIPLNTDLRLVTAISGGFVNHRLDYSALTFDRVGEMVNYDNTMEPDVSLGAWLHSSSMFLGASYNHVLNNKVNFFQDQSSANELKSRIPYQLYLINGYNISLGYPSYRKGMIKGYYLVPSFMLKYAGPGTSPSFDLNLMFNKSNSFRAGVSYRHQDAVSILLGLTILSDNFHHLEVTYSYDNPYTNVGNFTSGSHEIVLGYRFLKNRRLQCPENFW